MLYECCAELYKREGSGVKNTTCCPKESLLRLKMKQRAEEKGGGCSSPRYSTKVIDTTPNDNISVKAGSRKVGV